MVGNPWKGTIPERRFIKSCSPCVVGLEPLLPEPFMHATLHLEGSSSFSNFAYSGFVVLHGPHHVAKIMTTYTLPSSSLCGISLPSDVKSESSK